MAKKAQALGQVALGQEGSGLAQVFRPHDAGKYDAQLIALKQQKTKDDKLKRKTAAKPETLDLKDPWERDIEYYSNELSDLRQKQEQLYIDYADLQFLNGVELDQALVDYAKSQAEINTTEAELNDKLFTSGQQRKLSVESNKEYNSPKQSLYSSRTERNQVLYDNPPQELIEKYGSVEAARQYIKDNVLPNGAILEPVLDQNDFAKEIQGLQVASVRSSGGSTILPDGRVQHNTWKQKEYADAAQKAKTLSAYGNNQLALRSITEENHPLYSSLKEAYNVDDPSLLSHKEIYNFLENDKTGAVDQYFEDNYYLEDATSWDTKITGKGRGSGGISGVAEGDKVVEGLSNVSSAQSFYKKDGEEFNVDATAKKVLTVNGKDYVYDNVEFLLPSNAFSGQKGGEMPKSTSVMLENPNVAMVLMDVANKDIEFKVGDKKLTIAKGEPIPRTLADDPQFVSDYSNDISEEVYMSATVLDTDRGGVRYNVLFPAEDGKEVLPTDVYDEAVGKLQTVITYELD